MDGTIHEWGTDLERCIVEIKITATPRLKRKWDIHKYIVEIDETNGELKFYETALSNPHMEVPWPERV